MDPNQEDQSSSTPAQRGARGAASPYSPFPFGSPLTYSRGSVLNPSSSSSVREASNELNMTSKTPRLRGRDLYGSVVMFGSSSTPAASIRRSNRLLASTPYAAAQNTARKAARTTVHETPALTRPSTSRQPAPNTSIASKEKSQVVTDVSSTAKTILDTLERMSTPLRDAQKIPVPRSERRKALAEELLSKSTPYSRRRPRLGNTSAVLSGPPLRSSIFAQVKKKPVSTPPVMMARSSQPKPIAVNKKDDVSDEDYDPEITLNIPPYAKAYISGKIKTKISQPQRKLDPFVHEQPLETSDYLKKICNNPFANMKEMPVLTFSPPVKINHKKSAEKSSTRDTSPVNVFSPPKPLISKPININSDAYTDEALPNIKPAVNYFTKLSETACNNVFKFSTPTPLAVKNKLKSSHSSHNYQFSRTH